MNVLVYLVPLALGLGLSGCLPFCGRFAVGNTATSTVRHCACFRTTI